MLKHHEQLYSSVLSVGKHDDEEEEVRRRKR
jgi:hypothetical protein